MSFTTWLCTQHSLHIDPWQDGAMFSLLLQPLLVFHVQWCSVQLHIIVMLNGVVRTSRLFSVDLWMISVEIHSIQLVIRPFLNVSVHLGQNQAMAGRHCHVEFPLWTHNQTATQTACYFSQPPAESHDLGVKETWSEIAVDSRQWTWVMGLFILTGIIRLKWNLDTFVCACFCQRWACLTKHVQLL